MLRNACRPLVAVLLVSLFTTACDAPNQLTAPVTSGPSNIGYRDPAYQEAVDLAVIEMQNAQAVLDDPNTGAVRLKDMWTHMGNAERCATQYFEGFGASVTLGVLIQSLALAIAAGEAAAVIYSLRVAVALASGKYVETAGKAFACIAFGPNP